jgi:hypothetical protein
MRSWEMTQGMSEALWLFPGMVSWTVIWWFLNVSSCHNMWHLTLCVEISPVLSFRVGKAVYFMGKSTRIKYIEGILWRPHWDWMIVTDTDQPSRSDVLSKAKHRVELVPTHYQTFLKHRCSDASARRCSSSMKLDTIIETTPAWVGANFLQP